MTQTQFDLLARLLLIPETEHAALYRSLILNSDPETPEQEKTIQAIKALDQSIRSAYVTHTPSEFRVMVGHHDTHRKPGSLKLRVGDSVRLVAHSTERWIPVKITATPATPKEYYKGIITEQLVTGSKYQVGNGVLFGEDQVLVSSARGHKT